MGQWTDFARDPIDAQTEAAADSERSAAEVAHLVNKAKARILCQLTAHGALSEPGPAEALSALLHFWTQRELDARGYTIMQNVEIALPVLFIRKGEEHGVALGVSVDPDDSARVYASAPVCPHGWVPDGEVEELTATARGLSGVRSPFYLTDASGNLRGACWETPGCWPHTVRRALVLRTAVPATCWEVAPADPMYAWHGMPFVSALPRMAAADAKVVRMALPEMPSHLREEIAYEAACEAAYARLMSMAEHAAMPQVVAHVAMHDLEGARDRAHRWRCLAPHRSYNWDLRRDVLPGDILERIEDEIRRWEELCARSPLIVVRGDLPVVDPGAKKPWAEITAMRSAARNAADLRQEILALSEGRKDPQAREARAVAKYVPTAEELRGEYLSDLRTVALGLRSTR